MQSLRRHSAPSPALPPTSPPSPPVEPDSRGRRIARELPAGPDTTARSADNRSREFAPAAFPPTRSALGWAVIPANTHSATSPATSSNSGAALCPLVEPPSVPTADKLLPVARDSDLPPRVPRKSTTRSGSEPRSRIQGQRARFAALAQRDNHRPGSRNQDADTAPQD